MLDLGIKENVDTPIEAGKVLGVTWHEKISTKSNNVMTDTLLIKYRDM